MKLEKRSYEKGKPVFQQGDHGDCAFLVESGEVGIYKNVDGEQLHLGSLKSGEIFGEMAVIDGGDRMASAVAIEDCVLAVLPKTVFDAKLAGSDPFVRAILTIFMNNIRNAHKAYIRKPRSVPDYIRLLDLFTASMREYINLIEVSEFTTEMAEALARMEKAGKDLSQMALLHQDRRQSVMRHQTDTQGLPGPEVFGLKG
ncbi:MAG: cyclic nucleotide-binding domain-containing protein [Alphaproteobacteria bacterium]|nr:cyclic nucleotide-binding domain-containing protein [Alphaproteobacteria bacterium]